MGTKRRYSITKDKRRFNDDKYLSFNGNNKIVRVEKSFPLVNRYFDWSISWFDSASVLFDGSFNGLPVIQSGDWVGAGPYEDGWYIHYETENNSVTNKIKLFVANNGVVTIFELDTKFTSYNDTFNNPKYDLKHFVLNYDSSQNTLYLYTDSVLTDSIVITTDFQSLEEKSIIGSTNSIGSNSRNRNGGLKDICIFNKKLSQSEISYIYQTSVLPQSTHEYCYYHQTLNDSLYKRIDSYTSLSESASWDAGLILKERIGTNGTIEFTITESDSVLIVGLSTLSNPVANWNFSNILYGVYGDINSTQYKIITNGSVGTTIGTQNAGDVIKLEKIGTTINYYLNNVLQFTWNSVSQPSLTPTIIHYNNTTLPDGTKDKVKLVDLPILIDSNPSYDIEDSKLIASTENNSVEKNYDYDKNVISISSRDRNGVFDITFNDSTTNDMQCTVGVVGDLINGSPIDDKELQYGLYDTTNITNSTNIQYGFHVGSGTGNVFFATNGVLVDSGIPYVFNTTTIKVERVNTTINRYINGSLVDTVINVTGDLYPGYSLLKDEPTTPYFINNTINGIKNYYHLNYNSIQYYNDGIYSQELPSTIDNARHLYAGWTDDELLINKDTIGIIPNNAFKNFYSKKSSDNFGIRMDGNWETNNNEFSYYKIPTLSEDFVSNGWSMVIEGDLSFIVGNNSPQPFFNTSSPQNLLQSDSSTNSLTMRLGGVNDVLSYFRKDYEIPKSIVITFATSGDCKMYLNGNLVDSNNTTFSGLPLTNILFGVTGFRRYFPYFEGIYIYDKVLTDVEVTNSYKEPQKWLDLSPVVAYGTKMNGNNFVDLTGNYGDTTKSGDSVTTEHIVDTNSMFEPRKKGLQFNGTSQYLEVLNMPQIDVNEGVTVICSVNNITPIPTASRNFLIMDDSNYQRLIRFNYWETGGSIGFSSGDTGHNTQPIVVDEKQRNFSVYRINNNNANNNGNYYDGRKSRVGQVNCAFSVRGDFGLGRTDETYSTFIGGKPSGNGAGFLDCTIEYVAIFKGILNDAEVKELYNNGLFSNPSTTLQEKYDLELFVDFNNPFETGTGGEFDANEFNDDFDTGTGDIIFPDLSPNNYTIIANGWNSLGDLQNSQVDL